MNPDETYNWSEWMQPVHPIRILFKANEENRYYIHIFALRTSTGWHCQYLSIDGIFIEAQSKSVMFAETLIDGHWLSVGPRG